MQQAGDSLPESNRTAQSNRARALLGARRKRVREILGARKKRVRALLGARKKRARALLGARKKEDTRERKTIFFPGNSHRDGMRMAQDFPRRQCWLPPVPVVFATQAANASREISRVRTIPHLGRSRSEHAGDRISLGDGAGPGNHGHLQRLGPHDRADSRDRAGAVSARFCRGLFRRKEAPSRQDQDLLAVRVWRRKWTQ